MSFGDGTAVFAQRAKAIGLTDDVVQTFKTAQVDTMAKFAFACNYSPGASDDAPFKAMIKQVIGRDPSLVEESCLRRLFNESYATVAADIKAQTEQAGDDVQRKLAPADRAARLEEQQRRLLGISIRGPYEPGDTLVDRCVQLYENDRLQYIAWEVCVSREHELLTSSKKDQRLVVQSSGELKFSSSNKVEACDTSSEIMLRYCLMRRGLALEQANVLSYANHDMWLEKLLTCRLDTVPQGFSRPTFQQLEAADKRLFLLLSEKTRAGIKAGTAGRPCDVHFEACFNSTEVLSILQPKPLAVKSKEDEPPFKKLKSERPQFERSGSDRPMGKGKGKGKSKQSGNQFMRIPNELLSMGCTGATSQGHRPCFSYNLKKCSNAVQNQRCEKGLHLCAVKGLRFKATSFLTNHPAFISFGRQCDGTHPHLPWGFDSESQQFATALEAEYPKGLCDEYARTLMSMAKEQGIHVDSHKHVDEKLHPQKQHGGRTVPPLIPEYIKVVTVLLQEEPHLDGKRCLRSNVNNIPAGSKLLRSEAKGGVDSAVLCVFGIFHGHEQFVRVARSLWHPFDELRHLPDLMTRAIFELLSMSKLDNAKRRLDTLKLWRQWADELAMDESVIKEQMPPHVKGIMANKRLALLERVANRCLDWPDKRLHQELKEGFKIVGEAPATGVFRLQPKTGSMSESELMEQSKFLRPAIIGKTKSAGSGLHTKELFEITLTEATEKKWLQGPYCYEEVTQLLGRSWLPVRRFCVEQRGKLRPIDDFCENKLNNAFTTVDKISLRTMDHVVWAALIICKHCLHNHDMDFVLKDGERLRGPVHEDWHGASSMRATALDLKSAYKQLPLNADDVNKAVVTVFDEKKGEPSFFLMHTLPFGASASVLHFNRVGNLLWAAGCKLGLVWASYFDDYPVLCPDGLEQSSVGAAKAMLGLFGFDYSGDKLQMPDVRAELLGVELDLSLSSKGCVQVGNKKDRVMEIGAALDKILNDRSIRPKDIPSHLGRLQYASRWPCR
eukprot:s2396_g2.t1